MRITLSCVWPRNERSIWTLKNQAVIKHVNQHQHYQWQKQPKKHIIISGKRKTQRIWQSLAFIHGNFQKPKNRVKNPRIPVEENKHRETNNNKPIVNAISAVKRLNGFLLYQRKKPTVTDLTSVPYDVSWPIVIIQ